MAESHSDSVVGLVCRQRLSALPHVIHMTPGVLPPPLHSLTLPASRGPLVLRGRRTRSALRQPRDCRGGAAHGRGDCGAWCVPVSRRRHSCQGVQGRCLHRLPREEPQLEQTHTHTHSDNLMLCKIVFPIMNTFTHLASFKHGRPQFFCI